MFYHHQIIAGVIRELRIAIVFFKILLMMMIIIIMKKMMMPSTLMSEDNVYF
jgi:hypothetical protein